MSTAILIIIALIVLSLIIVIHELGHFVAAKLSGIWVEEFGIGLPPRVWGKKIGDTIYSVNLLPIGGFVRLHGEEGGKVTKPKRAYYNKPKRTRAFIAAFGIIMNFALAIVSFSIIYSFTGIPKETGEVEVLKVEPGTPAEAAGFMIDDVILKVDGSEVVSGNDFALLTSEKQGEEIIVELSRLEEEVEVIKEIEVTPSSERSKEEGALGLTVSSVELFYPPVWQRPLWGLYFGTKETIEISRAVVIGLVSIFVDLSGGVAPKGVVGPVGITALIAFIAKLGLVPLLNLVGLISVNLALLNLVPFPPLDGSRLVFIGAEAIFGKKVVPKVESIVNTIGIVILIALLLVLTVGEIPKLFKSGSLSGFIDSILPLE